MKQYLTIALLGALLLLPTSSVRAADLTDVKQIINKANLAAYYGGKDGRGKIRLTISDKQGRTRIRQFVMVRRNRSAGGDQDYLVLFVRPADVRKTVFLVAKKVKRDDDRWMYLPALDLVKRIAAGDKRTSFVGSHFFYEDISGRNVGADKHQLVKTSDKYYVVKNTPKKPGSVEFKSYTVWIDKKTFLPMRSVYLDKSGKKYREIKALKVETFDNVPTVTKMKVSNLRSGGHTISEIRGVKYGLNIPADVFAERSLRNPPRKWLKRR